MADEHRSNPEKPSVPDRVLILDAELESTPLALQVEGSVVPRPWRRERPDPEMDPRAVEEPAHAPGTRPVQLVGVDQGNSATEILDPFVRAIEVLLRGLAEALGEDTTSAATVQFGETFIQYSTPGWGDDVVRVYRTRPAGGDAAAGPATADADAFGRGSSDRPRDRWELGASAAREGNHAVALGLFEEEARDAEDKGLNQRAAIAYRSASREAGLVGRRDYANMLLRLAGKHYLFVAEDPHTSSRGKVQAFVTAAKCFLQAGNLALAESCIGRARSGAESLGDLG